MSLIGALNIGKSALAAHQAAIQVSSNNIANAGNPNYTRQVARLGTNGEQQLRPGLFMGTGVNVSAIERQIDQALETRLRSSISDTELAGTRQEFLGRVEAIFNELGDDDLSSQLSAFFNSWSQLANKPQDVGLRQVVVQNGQSLASSFRQVGTDLLNLKLDINARVAALTRDANGLLDKVADLNKRIVTAEAGQVGGANNLRDQRDAVLKELSGILDFHASETPEGMVNISVGQDVIVLNTTNRGVTFETESIDGEIVGQVVSAADGRILEIGSGKLGALAATRDEINANADDIDMLAGQLVFELNKLHSSGQGLEGFSTLISANQVDDSTAALNSDAAGLDFSPKNGSFVLQVTNGASKLTTSDVIDVDLDGLNGDDTTLESLRAAIDAVDGISASIVSGRLTISSDAPGTTFRFMSGISGSTETSNLLAALGLNSFFTGSRATDITVNEQLRTNPNLLAASQNGAEGDNQTALAIASLETKTLSGLGNVSLRDKYETLINAVAVSASSAKTSVEAAQVVQETLVTQRESLSGVSLDEEAVNLLREQRAFQGAARVISAVDELMRTLLNMV